MAEERTERRLAAILAADVVGYSRLMESDEVGTLDRLKALRREVFTPTITEFGGRIFKITGDGALAEFASAVDAVHSAVAVQRTLAERNATLPEEKRPSCASALASAMSSWRGATFTATGSMSPHGWRGWPIRVVYAFQAMFTSTSLIQTT